MSAKRSRETTQMKLIAMSHGCDQHLLRRVYRAAAKAHRIHRRASVKNGRVDLRTRPQRREAERTLNEFRRFFLQSARWKLFNPASLSNMWIDATHPHGGYGLASVIAFLATGRA